MAAKNNHRGLVRRARQALAGVLLLSVLLFGWVALTVPAIAATAPAISRSRSR
jgi:hypothetical protein